MSFLPHTKQPPSSSLFSQTIIYRPLTVHPTLLLTPLAWHVSLLRHKSGPTVSLERTSCLGRCCGEELDHFPLPTNTASLLMPRWHFAFTHSNTMLRARAMPESGFTSVPSPCAEMLPCQPATTTYSYLRATFCNYPYWITPLCGLGPHIWVHSCLTPWLETFRLQLDLLGTTECRT